MLSVKVDSERRLTIVTCSGKLEAAEVSEGITKHYDQGDPTPNTLWDLEKADLSGLSSQDVMTIAQLTASMRPDGLAGKTAIVASRDLAYGLGRMFETFSNLEKHTVEMRVFRSLKEAIAWMDES